MRLAAIALGKYMWPQIIALGNMISKKMPPPPQPAIQLREEIRAIVMDFLDENAKKKRDASISRLESMVKKCYRDAMWFSN
jgi:hypothetical protein